MTSIIGVKKLQYPNGTNAITIASDGTLTTDSDLTISGAATISGTATISSHTSIGGELTVSPSNAGNNIATIKTGSLEARLDFVANRSTKANQAIRFAVDSDQKAAFSILANTDLLARSEGGANQKIDLRQGSIKSWASVQQTANPHVVEDSYNVSSVTDNGTGKSGNNFTNNMNNANYSVTLAQQDGGGYNDAGSVHTDNADAYSTSAIGYYAHFATAPNDANTAWCQVAGDLA